MTKYFRNNFFALNLYKKPSVKSEIVTQIIYGESFSILRKSKKWLKIKIKEDNYKGYLKNKNFPSFCKPTHKVKSLKANIYKNYNKKKIVTKLPFGSRIKVKSLKKNLYLFEKGWVEKKNLVLNSYKEKDIFRKAKLFLGTKYKWGGKTFRGIDCSALVQICMSFNNKYCPRDSKDQMNFFKKKIFFKNAIKNDLIFWKGHVAILTSKKELIHAYGPLKKTLIMGINYAINRIKKTANLKVKSIKRV